MRKTNTVSVLLVLLAVVLVYIPKFILPVGGLDGIWMFSKAYSIIDGHWLYNEYQGQNSLIFYGMLGLIPMIIHQGIFTVHLFYVFVLIILGLFLTRKINPLSSLALIIPLLLIFDKSFQLHRAEPFFIMVGLIVYHYFIYRSLNRPILLLLFIVLMLLHPVNAALLMLSYLAYREHLFVKKHLFKYIGIYTFLAVFLGILYLIKTDNAFISVFQYRISKLGIGIPLKFLSFSGISLIALLYVLRKSLTASFIVNLSLLFIGITVLGTYYYYLFIFIPLLLKILYIERHPINLRIVSFALVFNILVTVIHPLFTIAENPNYTAQVWRIENQLRKLEVPAGNNIFIENTYAAGILAQHPHQTKMLLIDSRLVHHAVAYKSGDLIVQTGLDYHQKLINSLTKQNIEFKKELILEPVDGLLSLHSLYQKRTEDLEMVLIKIK